ncbi:MAG: transposase, partial [Aquabacterium sp.]|nr:transposase [Aquabacterium sp.]
MIAPQQLDALDPQQMRQALLSLMAEVTAKDELLARERREVAFKQALIDKLTHEVANLRRLKYAVTSEKFCAGISAEQKSLLDETLETDLAELAREIEQLDLGKQAQDKQEKRQPRREPLP